MATTESRAYKTYELSRWVARLGWLILVFALLCPAWRQHTLPTAQFAFPAILCLMYLWMVWEGRGGFKAHGLKTFFNLDFIGELYTNKCALNASWLHFLALDLFAGGWMVRDGLALGMPIWLVFLCLPLTLMLGPLGVLVYILLRFALFGFV
jgi:ABA4-like protein